MQIGHFRAANLFYNCSIIDCTVTQAQQRINAKAIGLAAGIIGLVAIIASLLATGYLSLKFLIQPQSTTIQNEITESIVTGIIDVKAREYESEEFQVPADASNAFVRGSFFANSGSVTDIKVMILIKLILQAGKMARNLTILTILAVRSRQQISKQRCQTTGHYISCLIMSFPKLRIRG